MFITIDRKTIRIDEERPVEERKRIRNIVKREDARLKAIEEDKKRRRYCPDCHTLLTVYHKCSNCGIVWNFHKTQH